MQNEIRSPLSIDANLSIQIDNMHPLQLDARGSRLELSLPSGRGRLFQLLSILPDRPVRQRAFDALYVALELGQCDLMIVQRDHQIASLVPGKKAGWLSRLLGLGRLRLHPMALLLSLIK